MNDRQRRAMHAKKATRKTSKRTATLTVAGRRLKQIGPNTYEYEANGRDYHVQHRRGLGWVADEFDSSIKNPEDAHLNTYQGDQLDEVIQ